MIRIYWLMEMMNLEKTRNNMFKILKELEFYIWQTCSKVKLKQRLREQKSKVWNICTNTNPQIFSNRSKMILNRIIKIKNEKQLKEPLHGKYQYEQLKDTCEELRKRTYLSDFGNYYKAIVTAKCGIIAGWQVNK